MTPRCILAGGTSIVLFLHPGPPWGIRFQRAACTLGGTGKGCPQGLRTRCASRKRTQPSHPGKTHSLLSIISTLTREFPRFHVSAVARPLCTRPDAKVRTGSCCSAPWGSSVSGILPLAAPTCPACDPFVNESTDRSSSPARAPVGKRVPQGVAHGQACPKVRHACRRPLHGHRGILPNGSGWHHSGTHIRDACPDCHNAATVFSKVPNSAISPLMRSPGCSFSFLEWPTPAGVPMLMMSPGSTVTNWVMNASASAGEKII